MECLEHCAHQAAPAIFRQAPDCLRPPYSERYSIVAPARRDQPHAGDNLAGVRVFNEQALLVVGIRVRAAAELAHPRSHRLIEWSVGSFTEYHSRAFADTLDIIGS